MSDDTTREFYRQHGLGGRVGFGTRAAVLIVDFIRGFTDLSSPLAANLDAEIAATQRLLQAARQKALLVNFTTTEYATGYADGGVFIQKIRSLRVLTKGSSLVEIDPRLAPLPNEIVWSKRGASAFFGTALAATLTAGGVDTVIVAGCTTSGCVRASVVDSCQYGFRTIVVREAVGDRATGPHEANLFDMDSKYADVVQLSEVLSYMSESPIIRRS